MSIEIPFKKFDEELRYESKEKKIADGIKVDNPNNKNIDVDLNMKNPNKKFEGTKHVINAMNIKEASEKTVDHPTPDEILAQLNNSFLGSIEKPKDSVEGSTQIVEGSTQKLEATTIA